MRLTTVLKEMTKVDVSFVSLVKRGANRIPFRVIKSDEKEPTMIDLSAIQRVLKGDPKPATPPSPEVVAVVIQDQGDTTTASVKAALASNGFEFQTTTKNEDGTVIFSSGELPDDSEIVRLSEDMALVVKGFSPYSDDMDRNASFSEIMAAQGYYQGVRTACEAVTNTIFNALYDSTDGTEAATKISTSLTQFTAYVLALTKGLPSKAFKAEAEVYDVLKAAAKPTELTRPPEVDEAEWNGMTEAEKKSCVADSAKKPAKKGEGSNPSVDNSATTSTPTITATPATNTPDTIQVSKGVLEQLTAIPNVLKDLADKLVGIDTFKTDITAQVAEIARKADNVSNAVQSTVVAGATGGDTPSPATVTTVKSDDPRTGAFDTAYIIRNR